MENKHRFGEKPLPLTLCVDRTERGQCDSGFLRFVKTHGKFFIQMRTLDLAKSCKFRNFRKKASHDSGGRKTEAVTP